MRLIIASAQLLQTLLGVTTKRFEDHWSHEANWVDNNLDLICPTICFHWTDWGITSSSYIGKHYVYCRIKGLGLRVHTFKGLNFSSDFAEQHQPWMGRYRLCQPCELHLWTILVVISWNAIQAILSGLVETNSSWTLASEHDSQSTEGK